MKSYLLQQSGIIFIQLQNGQGGLLLQDSALMCDQVEVQIPQTVVQEETTFDVTAYFRNRAAKTTCTPTTIHYRIDCLTTKSTVRDWTSVGSPAGANDITITSTDNKIIDTLSNVERKQIIVQGDRGLSTQITGKSAWTVNNLRGIGV